VRKCLAAMLFSTLVMWPTLAFASVDSSRTIETLRYAHAGVTAWNENGYWELPPGQCLTEAALVILEERNESATLLVQYSHWNGCTNEELWRGDATVSFASEDFQINKDLSVKLNKSVDACNGGAFEVPCRTVHLYLIWSPTDLEVLSQRSSYTEGTCKIQARERQTYGSATLSGSISVDGVNMLDTVPVRSSIVGDGTWVTDRKCN
jgi:hypothetical protein